MREMCFKGDAVQGDERGVFVRPMQKGQMAAECDSPRSRLG